MSIFPQCVSVGVPRRKAVLKNLRITPAVEQLFSDGRVEYNLDSKH